jgi:chitinase
MKKLLLIAFILLLTQIELFSTYSIDSDEKIIAAYYPYYNKVFYSHNDIDFKSITHLCHSFIKPDSSGNLIVDDNFLYPELNEAAHNNGVQVLVSIGGWGNHDGFSPMASDSISRQNFIKNLTEFCLKNNYDGADIDWEYPRKVDKHNFIILLKELKDAFDLAGIKYLTAAIPSDDYTNVFNVAEMNKYLDWIGIMTYDFHGSWSNHSGHNSPLYSSPLDTCGSIDYSVNYYLSKGISREKLLIGIPLYGRIFNSPALYLKNDGSNSILLQNSVARITDDGWKYVWDHVCEAPLLYSSDNTQLISYEDVNSIKIKSRYIYNQKLGGAIVWALGQDYDGNSTLLLESLKLNMLFPPSEKPSTPIIASTTSNGININLNWYPAKDAWYYEIEISSDSLFSEIIFRKNNIQSTENFYNKLKDGEYFWRVRAHNYLGYSEWSKTGVIKPKNEN